MANKILLRRDYSLNWADPNTNPILEQGEPGFEINSNRLKIGNGTSRWNDLPYLNSEAQFPPNSPGYLKNNGDGTLTWEPLNYGFSGDYSDLENRPFIPTDVRDLDDNDNLLRPQLDAYLDSIPLLSFDFGTIIPRIATNKLEWLLINADIDGGTIQIPANADYDAGDILRS
ncbi:MAG: hypothetical protein EBT86_05085 [Actinobacteria bacterium]|nr:hypothetical protein [Actinomycetota bacterium]